MAKKTRTSSKGGDKFLDFSTVKEKREKKQPESRKDAEELRLEEAIFGNLDEFKENLGAEDEEVQIDEGGKVSEQEENGDVALLDDSELFMMDVGEPSKIDSEDAATRDVDMLSNASEDEDFEEEQEEAVWHDSDDERVEVSLLDNARLRKLRRYEDENMLNGVQYSARLRVQFERIYPKPKWALKKTDDDGENSDEEVSLSEASVLPSSLREILQSSVSYAAKKTSVLQPGQIDIKRLKDANFQSPSHSGIRCMSLHPIYPLLLTCGFDRTLRIYQLDGRTNPLLTSMHLRSSDLQTAAFHPDGKHVIAGGRRRYFYIWDLETSKVQKVSRIYGHQDLQPSMERFHLDPSGKFMALEGKNGYVNMLDALTGQFVTNFKIEGTISDVLFDSNGANLFVLSYEAEVWQFDIKAKTIVRRWHVQDAVATTRFSLDSKNRYMAIGSKSGIVNVYELARNDAPKAIATLDNITFSINSLAFSTDGQVLLAASRGKKDTLRLYHVPSFTTFRNWPTSVTPLGRVTAVIFGKGGELCVGNEAGRVGFWKLAHYL
ncbi:CGI-48 family protein [Schizosaccharomyces japonicus yFS275]|uniref:CGI-48 family protein n=1 Tax=Schizosaccharomyces japonicus (strain yFS275 / FY16936) TaxID=402676 RepID=B6JVX3_SCHJY|nr:CGI-48 family protein [Schizosaccharomyces japonicus yFS275]EEB05524.1 CGI-48 family protein [Schizosaccharomyces japonicus yFS275]